MGIKKQTASDNMLSAECMYMAECVHVYVPGRVSEWGFQWVSEPEFQSISIHTIEVILMQVLVSYKAKVFIETKSCSVSHFCLKHNLSTNHSYQLSVS